MAAEKKERPTFRNTFAGLSISCILSLWCVSKVRNGSRRHYSDPAGRAAHVDLPRHDS